MGKLVGKTWPRKVMKKAKLGPGVYENSLQSYPPPSLSRYSLPEIPLYLYEFSAPRREWDQLIHTVVED